MRELFVKAAPVLEGEPLFFFIRELASSGVGAESSELVLARAPSAISTYCTAALKWELLFRSGILSLSETRSHLVRGVY